MTKWVDPNGTRITQALFSDRTALTIRSSPILCLLVEPYASFDQSFGYPPRQLQPRIRLRPTLHRARLVTVRAIAHALLTDQLQQPRQVRRDPRRVVQVARLERPDGMQRAREAEPPRTHLLDPRRLRHDPLDQVVRQQGVDPTVDGPAKMW